MTFGSERGITVVELLVAISAGIAVLFGSFAVLNGTLRGSARTQQRVDATQRARPVMTRIMDELHSVCVAPGIPPVYAGSGDDTVIFLHKNGNDVTPNPDRRTITLSSGILSETIEPYATGVAPNWTFGAPTTVRLLTNVMSAQVNGSAVPLFQYHAYANDGTLDPTPLQTPLSTTNAARTVQVTVSFAAAPSKTQIDEGIRANTSVTDTAFFRFTPAGEDANQTNLPCA
jgi:hypothetical protein